ncbi:hypothetical protein JIN85_08210 [Luteolibacter pohnpeiensis]|uniref:Endonuclease/exonuclease/phosphatase domain-containing protein n=1 Tax=Luteolibacter pohnpeiensis TaxID=454153 RepID=A0A934VWD8_9BACT|nr:endonuclease/exonuclease/phosphatase family protein [Luteolibacter pohnpeiensis]MBK1882394.1 hypothetical protein [Luteolibacter pohnpeiensis]
MNTRYFFFLLALVALLLPGAAEAQRIRIVAGNISSGNYQSYDPGEGARIFKGLKPDIVLIQEFNYKDNTTADIRSFVTSTFGAEFSYFREAGAQIPNGVISRYPILESGEWEDAQVSNRDFAWARIDIPGDKDLWAISVHLLTTSSKRNPEAIALVDYIKAKIPDDDYLVIGGDFNSSSRNETQFTTFSQVVHTAGPYPADQNGDEDTNASRAKPYDNVFADDDLLAIQVPVVIGNSTFANGLVADTRVYTPISEISPALVTDSAASNMQHMAVVKDFMVPIPDDPAVIPIISSSFDFTPPAHGSIAFRSTPLASYQIEATSDLTASNWTTLGEMTAEDTTTTLEIVTANAAASQLLDILLGSEVRRFYRILRK